MKVGGDVKLFDIDDEIVERSEKVANIDPLNDDVADCVVNGVTFNDSDIVFVRVLAFVDD